MTTSGRCCSENGNYRTGQDDINPAAWKDLLPVLNKPLLEYQVERLRRVRLSDDLIIATTENETDEPIVELCRKLQALVFAAMKRMSWPGILERP